MSVFGPYTGSSGTDKLFLEYVMPGMTSQLREDSKLYDRFKTNSQDLKGKYALFKCNTASPKSFRPSSSTTLPTAQQGTYDEFLLFMKRGGYGQLQFDGLALACGKGKGAVMEILSAELDSLETYMSRKLNHQYWGDGSGRLGQLSAASSNSTTVVIDGPLFGQDSNEYTNPAEYLHEGMLVDIYDTSGNLEVEEVEISTITDNGDGTATIVMAEAVTASDDSYIFDHDTYAASQAIGTGVPQGLTGIISTADPYTGITETSFQNIDRDTYTWARAQNVSCASAAISNVKILQLIQKIEKFGTVGVMFTNEVIYRCYYEILEADKTMPNDPAFWGGLSGITFYGGKKGKITLLNDTDCPDNSLYAWDDKYIEIFSPTKNGMTWLKGENGILRMVSGKDEWVASLVNYYNMGSRKPQAMGYLSAIKHASL